MGREEALSESDSTRDRLIAACLGRTVHSPAVHWPAEVSPVALPLDVLERSINKKMALQLKDGRVIEGKLVGYDQYMNLVLEEGEERHTTLKPGEAAPQTSSRRLGTVILRGNNVVTISPQ